jgi:hypothetical protein
MPTMLRGSSLLLSMLLVSCGFAACGGPAASAPGPASSSIEPAASASAGTYELHEWGLLRGGPGDVLEVGTFAPPLQVEPMVVEKPVLYFHGHGTAPIELSAASVEAVEGTIREHWPLAAPRVGEVEPARISWAPLTLRPERCALLLPADRASACSALPADEVCESLSLARTVTDDAWCVETASGPSPLLFYRSTSRGLAAPLTASVVDGGDLEVRNVSDAAIPGMIVRFIESAAGLTIVAAAPPAPGTSVRVGSIDGGEAAGRDAITASMRELGMTSAEIAAFLGSWENELFGPPGEGTVEQPVEEIVEERTVLRSTLLYFLPASMTDRVSRLTFTPTPSATRRALAIWTAI